MPLWLQVFHTSHFFSSILKPNLSEKSTPELAKMSETVLWCNIILQFGESVNLEGAGFMTYAAASHKGAIKICFDKLSRRPSSNTVYPLATTLVWTAAC